MSEEELDFVVLFFDKREDGVVNCVEHFGGVGADVVEEELDGVEGFGGGGGEFLACELGCERHCAVNVMSFVGLRCLN